MDDAKTRYTRRAASLQSPDIRNHLRTGREYKAALQAALERALQGAQRMYRRTDRLLKEAGG